MAPLTFALPKGRLLDPALQLLSSMGIRGLEVDTRRLLLTDAERDLRFIFLKPADIPTYVEYGAADLGIVGKDILAEQQPDVYEPIDLGFGFCRLVVAEPRELWERDDPTKWSWVRVATKYPALTEHYFSDRGIQVEMIHLDGSIELAPLVGLAERIVDLVQSGETLRANGLVEVAEIMTSTARLIVNRDSLKTAPARVNALIGSMRGGAGVIRRQPRHLGAGRGPIATVRRRGRADVILVEEIVAGVRVKERHGAPRVLTLRSGRPLRRRLAVTAGDGAAGGRGGGHHHARSVYRGRIRRFHRRARHVLAHDGCPGLSSARKSAAGARGPRPRQGDAYPSTVLMTVIPARVAGVKEIVLVSPPSPDKSLNPAVLAAARVAGVTEAYRIGGAQAVAALAYGTETIRRVDKIVGPGNIYVALAKGRVFGDVGIDMIAGPSEVMVVADASADPGWAADLLAQAEHDPMARAVLLTPSRALIDAVAAAAERQLAALPRREIAEAALRAHGALVLTRSLEEAVEVANLLAPEHLELQVADPDGLLAQVRNAGAVFLGRYTPEVVGDYVAGPNHVLPTGVTARFASALGTEDFVKRLSVIQYAPAGLRDAGPHLAELARVEGLDGHGAAAAIRIESTGDHR
jgi:histidinol dehydrogenase